MKEFLKHWEFIFAIFGAIITAVMMFGDLKEELAVQQNDIKYIRQDVTEIKEALRDSDRSALSERLANHSGQAVH